MEWDGEQNIGNPPIAKFASLSLLEFGRVSVYVWARITVSVCGGRPSVRPYVHFEKKKKE